MIAYDFPFAVGSNHGSLSLCIRGIKVLFSASSTFWPFVGNKATLIGGLDIQNGVFY